MNRGIDLRSYIRTLLPGLIAALLLAAPPAARSAPAPARGKPAAKGAAASGTGTPIARVGQLTISGEELDQNERQAHQLYRDRNHTDLAPELLPLVRRQVLENLIRQRLLALDARQSGIKVSDAEAEAQIKLDPAFQTNGLFNEAKYLAIKSANADRFAQAMAAQKDAIAARKAGERMDRETRPDRVAIRAQVEREQTRATIDFLALRRRDFDGSVPEPREADVLAYYAAHREEFRRPEQASLSMVLFNRPAPADSAGATDAGYRAWEQRMRTRADSAMTALRGGAPFDELALRNGGAKKVTIARDDQPDPWRGGPREVSAAFAAAPGTVLSTPVRAAPGWALVRVDARLPSRTAPLADVAREIRATLRARARAAIDDRQLAEVYGASKDSLRGPGYRVRYALADTSSFPPGEPGAQDLDRFYRAHLADYSTYQRASGEVVETPFVEVKDEIRRRWARERSRDLARNAAERLRESWSKGRRDAALERSMTLVRDLGIVPVVGDPDTGRAAAALATALTMRRGEPGIWTMPAGGGTLVIDLGPTVPDYLPTLAQARSRLQAPLEARRAAESEAAARIGYDANPSAYRSRPLIQFSRLLVEPPDYMKVKLTHDEVERYFRSHLDAYSAEELVHVRHILIATSGAGALPDAEARARAESLLTRLRAGGDFATLAAQYSDDPATKLEGGDVGMFRRGQMREAFERAAFAMRPGDITGPVRTEVGYHILECLEYLPPKISKLVEVYANVAYDCAQRKAKRLAGERADSLYRTIKSVAQAKAVAKRLGLEILGTEHEVGDLGRFDLDLLPYIQKIETLKPGQIYPGTQLYEGLGYVISWIDTIIPPRALTWDEARARATDQYRRDRAEGALLAKRAELDSMAAAGWSFDSLATLWGRAERLNEGSLGDELRGMGGRARLDSLAFGGVHPPVLEVGKPTGWIEFPGGLARLKLVERLAPDAEDLDRRVEKRAQLVLWRNLRDYFDRLRSRYPVEILDGELRATALLEPTES
jgi:parvulin-like peptidyl-prolyl isomerase